MKKRGMKNHLYLEMIKREKINWNKLYKNIKQIYKDTKMKNEEMKKNTKKNWKI